MQRLDSRRASHKHKSKALDEAEVREPVLKLCDVLQISVTEGYAALKSDAALIAFTGKHKESLDWIICGDERLRRHRPAK